MKKNYQKGIAIFIAVISVSSLLLIALAISDMAYKEQIISYSGRDSKIAFYAADTGVECALYHDLRGGPNGTFKFITKTGDPTPNPRPVCAGATVREFSETSALNQATSTFFFNLSASPLASPQACSIVRISKVIATDLTVKTKIDSRGYNTSCIVAVGNITLTQSPRNLERAFEVNY